MDRQVSADGTRACVVQPFGIACYEGETVDGRFSGAHRGVVGSAESADRWLAGERPDDLIVVYGDWSGGP